MIWLLCGLERQVWSSATRFVPEPGDSASTWPCPEERISNTRWIGNNGVHNGSWLHKVWKDDLWITRRQVNENVNFVYLCLTHIQTCSFGFSWRCIFKFRLIKLCACRAAFSVPSLWNKYLREFILLLCPIYYNTSFKAHFVRTKKDIKRRQ